MNGNSGSRCCLMCLCVVVSLSSGCVISRVCMWAFSFLRVIHCVSVLSMPSECCVCAVVCGLIWFLPSTVCLFVSLPAPWTSALANKSTHCNLVRPHFYSCVHTHTERVASAVRGLTEPSMALQPLSATIQFRLKDVTLMGHISFTIAHPLKGNMSEQMQCCNLFVFPRLKVVWVSGAIWVMG